MNIESIGIQLGHTVTPSIMDAAIVAELPQAAMDELWPTRTINKVALQRINDAIAEETEPEPEPETEEQSL